MAGIPRERAGHEEAGAHARARGRGCADARGYARAHDAPHGAADGKVPVNLGARATLGRDHGAALVRDGAGATVVGGWLR
jgi:hypothetical protein